LGHHNGDRLLRAVGERLRSAVRASDTVARLGSDEFSVLLPGASAARAVETVDRLNRVLADPIVLGEHRLAAAASVGIAIFPEHGADAETLLRCADVARYAAKRAGEGHALYAPTQERHSAHRLVLVQELSSAIEQNELVLHFQPRVALRSGQLDGVEAL